MKHNEKTWKIENFEILPLYDEQEVNDDNDESI